MKETPKSLTKKKRGVRGTDSTTTSSASASASATSDGHGMVSRTASQQPQLPAGDDVEIGTVDIDTVGTPRRGRYISPQEKADFNARLEERRKQRRDERTRRKHRQDKHRSIMGGSHRGRRSAFFRSRTAILIAVVFFIVLCGWMFTFLYLAHDMGFVNGGVKSPSQLRNRMSILKDVSNNIKNNIKDVIHDIPKPFVKKNDKNDPEGPGPVLHGNPDEVVDMRDLNYELPFADENGGAWTQGWDVQPIELTKTKPLRIFVVPHSHCDPGWIKTFDEYFQSQTKQIISSVIESLLKDPRRKFIWAEISYFEWWWKEQSESTQQDVRKLLKNKQFEFVTGGWVQPDEANTQLYAMEIQLEEGHDFIKKTFGEEYIPKYGWSIDPFGYSPTMAYLLKKHGFKGMLIQRVHYAIKKELALHKRLEFMWRQTWDNSPDGSYDMFTHVMPFYSYDVPHTCGPDPSVCCQFDFARARGVKLPYDRCPWNKDSVLINDRNLEKRSLLLLDQYRKKANLYRSNVVIAPLGDDFRYMTVREAELQYENYQKIFDYINANVDNVEISFGTLSDYFETVINERPFAPPLLKGSFFTYSDREQDYWSGYFTSRIFDKALDRKLERTLYAASALGGTKEELQGPRRALSLFQHHDGVTGTAKDAVVVDYAKRIHKAIEDTQNWILQHLITTNDHGRSINLARQLKLMACWQSSAPRGLAENLCDHGADTKVIVYNPLETEQSCGSVVVPGRQSAHAMLPCETPGALTEADKEDHQTLAGIKFDPTTGLMIHPIREEWMVWKVKRGGAYLFFPDKLGEFTEYGHDIQNGGAIVETENWKRTVVERKLPKGADGKQGGIAIDFVYETNLQNTNQEWFARFTHPEIQNQGVFHTDLNGYNFDTHRFRSDMPIQSQVFPMPTLASIEDMKNRMTVLSEHAQGAASLEESAIDVWLDRRLGQDDERGLAQGVEDNVPTRTRLRVVLEETPKPDKTGEFSITPFCKRQWKELNHPLEMFGSVLAKSDDNKSGKFAAARALAGVLVDIDAIDLDNRSAERKKRMKELDPHNVRDRANQPDRHEIAAVYMVYQRVEYLKQAIDTLRESDYPESQPVVISHDGQNKEVIDYVESLKKDLRIIQIFHPYSCSEHPDSFPGEDPELNRNYEGDTFGNKRDSKITCCKHHFTWLINTVFGMKELQKLHGFLFLEEDYIVAPTVYETMDKAFTYIDSSGLRDQFFGVTLDPSDAYAYHVPFNADWLERSFVTGPMAIRRDIFAKIKEHAKDFCEWDDYNWDWSIVHLMSLDIIPFKVLSPGTLQAAHIGLEGGMHGSVLDKKRMAYMQELVKDGKLERFFAEVKEPKTQRMTPPKVKEKGFGGWGHPADQQHCMDVFNRVKK